MINKIYCFCVISLLYALFSISNHILAEDSYENNFITMTKDIESGNYKNLSDSINAIIERLQKMDDKGKRCLQVSKFISFLDKCNDEKVSEIAYQKITVFVNNEKYGRENCLAVMLWLRKFGTLKYVKTTGRIGLKGERGIKYSCYYNNKLSELVQQLYELYKNKSPVDEKLINSLYSESRKDFENQRKIFLSDEIEQCFIDMFFRIDNGNLRESILYCFVLSGRYEIAYSYAMLMSNTDGISKRIADKIVKEIPSSMKGKQHSNYLEDKDEIE